MGNYKLRSDESIKRHGVAAMTLLEKDYVSNCEIPPDNLNVKGVHTVSALSLLPHFDIRVGSIVESMHQAYLGVLKQDTLLFLGEST